MRLNNSKNIILICAILGFLGINLGLNFPLLPSPEIISKISAQDDLQLSATYNSTIVIDENVPANNWEAAKAA
ncbi:MAG: hypothetical protein R3255_11095, partial [Candidatus Lokiarchaeia archaeon]|nr:hypothetical protein [Candidatus Lokiarchaeia archaeon]